MFSKLKIYNQSSRFQIADNQATENEIDSHEEAENETVNVILEATSDQGSSDCLIWTS